MVGGQDGRHFIHGSGVLAPATNAAHSPLKLHTCHFQQQQKEFTLRHSFMARRPALALNSDGGHKHMQIARKQYINVYVNVLTKSWIGHIFQSSPVQSSYVSPVLHPIRANLPVGVCYTPSTLTPTSPAPTVALATMHVSTRRCRMESASRAKAWRKWCDRCGRTRTAPMRSSTP